MSTIYTLELDEGKYYVGRSNKPNKRILSHFNESGSEWTKLYKPIRIISQTKGDEFDEEKHTLIAMDKYGVDNVRGGSYCKTKMTEHDNEKAQQTINSIMDKCYKCGKKGHFSKDCNNEDELSKKTNIKESKINNNEIVCDICYGSGRRYWSDDCYGSCLECCCINCGKNDRYCECCCEVCGISEKKCECVFDSETCEYKPVLKIVEELYIPDDLHFRR